MLLQGSHSLFTPAVRQVQRKALFAGMGLWMKGNFCSQKYPFIHKNIQLYT